MSDKTLDLVSVNSDYVLALSPNVDRHDERLGMRVVEKGQKFRFRRHRATVPADVREKLEAHPNYRRLFYIVGDPDLPKRFRSGGLSGPRVVSGQLHGRSAEMAQPPLPDWDETGARALRQMINAGRVPDLVAATTWEAAHRARGQVLEALGQAIRASSGEEDPTEPEVPESAEGGYVPSSEAGGI